MARINQHKMGAYKHAYNHTNGKWFKTSVEIVVDSSPFEEGAMRSAV